MKIQHIKTGKIYEIIGSCYFREEDESLWIAVSYLDWEETNTISFSVIDDGVINPDYILIP